MLSDIALVNSSTTNLSEKRDARKSGSGEDESANVAMDF